MSEHGVEPSAPGLAGISKFLSYVLRHAPDSIGLSMDGGGWVEVQQLIRCAEPQYVLSPELLANVVDTSSKQRFALSADGRRIRANQGHSIDVDLGLTPVIPPDTLFHGTAARFLEAIMTEGLRPGDRNHVHLSADVETAMTVGQRHGRPVVLVVDGASMQREGSAFYRSENGVWLTDSVPARHLSTDF